MTEYKCGHEGKPIIMDSNPISIAVYLEWKDTVGYDGDKTECWECYCERTHNEELMRRI